MKPAYTLIHGQGQISALVALGFFAMGMIAFPVVLGLLAAFPDLFTGDPYRLETLSFITFVVLGFVCPFLFGCHYAVSSLLTGSSLWSQPIAVIHIALHGIGLIWMMATFGGRDFMQHTETGLLIGGLLILAGIGLMVLNSLVTANRLSRWEPPNITVACSLFWLTVLVALGFALVINHPLPFLGHDPVRLLELHVTLALGGFLWMGLLGMALKLFTVFLPGATAPGALSWTGCIVINTALLLMLPLLMIEPAWSGWLAGAVLVGGLFYFADIVRLLYRSRKGMSPGIIGALGGIIGGLVLTGFLVVSPPPLMDPSLPDLRGYLASVTGIAILVCAPLVLLGFGMRMIPFLVWRIRCMPLIGYYKQPHAGFFSDKRGEAGCILGLAAGTLYTVAAFHEAAPAGFQIAALCLLIGTVYFWYAVGPALRVFLLGIYPEKPTEKSTIEPLS